VEEDMEEPQEIRILHNPEVARKRKREDYVEGQESIERLVRKMNDIEQKMEIMEREREKYETKSSGSKGRGRKRVCGLQSNTQRKSERYKAGHSQSSRSTNILQHNHGSSDEEVSGKEFQGGGTKFDESDSQR
jgi:hypothetical protein